MAGLNFQDTLFEKNPIRILKIEDPAIDYPGDQFVQAAFDAAVTTINTQLPTLQGHLHRQMRNALNSLLVPGQWAILRAQLVNP